MPVLDQDHPGSCAAQPVDPGVVWAQTFVAGITGALTQVNLAIATEPSFDDFFCPFSGSPGPCVPGDLTISIRDTMPGIAHVSNGFDYSNTAPRVIPTDIDLASTTVPAAAVPNPDSLDLCNMPLLNITFAAPAQVSAGNTYAIVVESGGTARRLWSVAATTNFDTYPEGTMFFSTQGSWYDYSYQPYANASGNVEYIKAQFQTFVESDATPPSLSCAASPNSLWPPNGKSVLVTVSGSITDADSGVDASSAMYAVTDEYGQVQPSGGVTVGADGTYAFGVSLEASRDGTDRDGRTYTIVVSGTDMAGNVGSCSAEVIVPHDQGKKK